MAWWYNDPFKLYSCHMESLNKTKTPISGTGLAVVCAKILASVVAEKPLTHGF